MKQCPECGREYDNTMAFCLDDGAELLYGPASGDEPATAIFSRNEGPTGDGKTEIFYTPADSRQSVENSIAVLPFANISTEAENEYFCDGLAEELLNALAKIERLKVAARTSAFSFKGKNTDASEIANALGVKKILEGSVRKSGDKLRITVQLIDGVNGYHLWSERFDRDIKDIFELQDEITLAVVDALKVTLFGEEKASILKRYTDNTEAYELYLKGRYHYHKYTPEGWLKAIELFEQAIEKEPEYAPAYAKMSAAIAFCWFFNVLSSDETIDRWTNAARRALELDDRMEDAYEALGRLHFYHDWNWSQGEDDFLRGIEINPKNAELHAQYGLALTAIGRFDEALAEGSKALELDPLSILVNLQVGWLYLFSGHLDKALHLAQKILEIEPTSYGAYCQIGVVLSAKRNVKGALKAFQDSLALGRFQVNLSLVASMFAFCGLRREASEILDQLLEAKKSEPIAALDIARIYSAMDESDKALDWLERAIEERNGGLVFIRSKLAGFAQKTRQDPRFGDLVSRIGLPA